MKCDNYSDIYIIDTSFKTLNHAQFCNLYNGWVKMLNYSMMIYNFTNHYNRHNLREYFKIYNKKYILCEKCLFKLLKEFFLKYYLRFYDNEIFLNEKIIKYIKMNRSFNFPVREYTTEGRILYDCFKIKIKNNEQTIFDKIKLFFNL